MSTQPTRAELRDQLIETISPIVPNSDGVIWDFGGQPVTLGHLADSILDGPLAPLIDEIAREGRDPK